MFDIAHTRVHMLIPTHTRQKCVDAYIRHTLHTTHMHAVHAHMHNADLTLPRFVLLVQVQLSYLLEREGSWDTVQVNAQQCCR